MSDAKGLAASWPAPGPRQLWSRDLGDGYAFLTAVDVKTGKMAWQDRSFARANLLHAGGKLIVLDEDGRLALATASPEGLKVHAKAELLQNNAWTAPTLVGDRLYVRDRKRIMALVVG